MRKHCRLLIGVVVGAAWLALATGCPSGPSPGPPALSVSSNERNFGATLTEMTFTITNTGGGNLEWSLAWAESWITLDPTSGVNDATVTVTVDRSSPALGVGLNMGMILVDTDIGDELIAVTVLIGAGEGEGEGDPALSYWPEALEFGADSEMDLTVMNGGGGTLDWHISRDAAWFSAAPSSGTGHTRVAVTIDRSSLAAGPHEANLTITSNGGDATIRVTALGFDPALDYGLDAYWPLAVGNEWTWSQEELLWRLTITDAFVRNSVPVWAFQIDDNWGVLGTYYFVYAEDRLYVLSSAAELADLPDVPHMSCRTWDGSCSFPLFEDDVTPGPGYDPFNGNATTYAAGSLSGLLDFYGVYEADYALADFPVGDPDDCIGLTWTEDDATTVYTVFAPDLGLVVWDSWRLRHAVVDGVEYGTPMDFGPGLGVSENPDNDLLYYARQPDGTFVYYCGLEEGGRPRLTHAIVKDAYDVIGGVVIFNEDFLPVQWLFDGLTVAAFDLPPAGWDPEVDGDW